jgi:hypothetical protein
MNFSQRNGARVGTQADKCWNWWRCRRVPITLLHQRPTEAVPNLKSDEENRLQIIVDITTRCEGAEVRINWQREGDVEEECDKTSDNTRPECLSWIPQTGNGE